MGDVVLQSKKVGMVSEIKSSLSFLFLDGSMICGRMQTILEEVLWVVTLPQLRSAITFGKHILELIKMSSDQPSSTPKAVKSIVSIDFLVKW
jgi:hypothetical protein